MAKKSVSRRTNDRGNRGAQVIRPVSLSAQLKKMFRHPGIILLAVLAGAALAAVASFITPASYQATATVIASPLTDNPNATATNQLQVDIDTEAGIADSREVAEKAGESLSQGDNSLVSTLRNSVEVSAHSSTSILDITATAANPQDAADYANAVAQAYLDVRKENLEKIVATNAQSIRDKINALSNDQTTQRTKLEEQLAQVELTSTSPGRVISQAQIPSSPSNLGLPQYIAVGAIAGLLVGMVLAWITDNRKRRLGYRDRAEDITGSDVFEIRSSNRIEDSRRMLRSLGVKGGDFRAAGLKGAVVYSPTDNIAAKFADYLKEATEGSDTFFSYSLAEVPTSPNSRHAAATVVLAAATEGYAQVLNAADALGAAIIVLAPATSAKELEEFSTLAADTSAQVEYVFLQK